MIVGNWKDSSRDRQFLASNYDNVSNGRVGISIDIPAPSGAKGSSRGQAKPR